MYKFIALLVLAALVACATAQYYYTTPGVYTYPYATYGHAYTNTYANYGYPSYVYNRPAYAAYAPVYGSYILGKK